MKQNKLLVLLPIIIAIVLASGVYLGKKMATPNTTLLFDGSEYLGENKLQQVINYIKSDYVDTVKEQLILEETINEMLQNLDPHSYYIPKRDYNAMNDPLEGNFEGIGIEFRIQQDTVVVIRPVGGGPSEKLGIRAGDRIIKVEGEDITGEKINNKRVIKLLKGPKPVFQGDRKEFVEQIRQALYASKIISYAQGYVLMKEAAKEHNWELNYGEIAQMWRGGCIIRSAFLGKITEAFNKNPELKNLVLDPFFMKQLHDSLDGWRKVVATSVINGIPVPAFSTALAYYDGYRTERLPANMLQAQRDYFGAHTYERVDKPRGEFFHTNWTGRGGDTASSTYNV